MATINDVLLWANTLPDWLADAVRRLLAAGEEALNPKEYSEILTLAKAHLKLSPVPSNVAPVPPTTGMYSGVPATTVSVKLLSINDAHNVNAIISGQSLPFSESGITVIYGDNGSGKSGYSRILKLACQARDKEERILPNVFATALVGTPTATLKIKQDGATKDIPWTQGVAADPVLTNITVFDGRCARLIIDSRNEISYLPYGGDIFQKMVEIVRRVKADVEAEIVDIAPIQDSAVIKDTPAAKFIESLSASTKEEAIQVATTWTSQDEVELSNQEDLVRRSDPTKAMDEITRIKKIKGRVDDACKVTLELAEACRELMDDALNVSLAEVDAAQLAHATAVAERQTPEPLLGVASTNQWEILYKAAKQYSEEVAYPEQLFPYTSSAVCVLCQQPLGEEAVARFDRFKRFMEDATSSALVAKRDALKSLRERFEKLSPLSGAALDSICDELTSVDAKAAEALRTFHAEIAVRKSEAILYLNKAQAERNAVLPPWPASVETVLRSVSLSVAKKIEAITLAAKPEEYTKLVDKVAQLKSRKALSARKADIKDYVEKIKRNAELRSAADTIRTTEITKQGTKIIAKNLTPALRDAIKAEVETLGATRVPISVKPSGDDGETAHEMLLEGAGALGKARMSQVLSEGEARVIAIAGFLAELQLDPHANAIVFDDPVSSVDHVFTAKIAERLAREGLKRQVIVFTHNIAFLMELQDSVDALAKMGTPVAIAVNTLRRDGKSAGITLDGAPWYALKVIQRVQYVEQLVHKIKPLYLEDMTQYNEKAARAYGLLREAWEACVEDDLFYSVVCRHRNSVQTLKLIQVEIEDTDIHHVNLHMSKASTWMTGHDKSKALHSDRPAPDELLTDATALRIFSKKIIARRDETEKRRKEQLKA